MGSRKDCLVYRSLVPTQYSLKGLFVGWLLLNAYSALVLILILWNSHGINIVEVHIMEICGKS